MAESGSADLKRRHRAMWALGDYPSIAAEVIPALGRRLVEACRIGPGQRVLDIAAGSGNAAIPAAEAGADVVASDLTPELFEAGRRIAAARGVELRWQEADAEALPYADAEFDAVISCVGLMFAPFHQAAADELVRVVKPGGTIGLINWTPSGFIGQMFATMKPFAPPPPPGAQPPPLWGDEAHVRSLLGDRVADLELRRENAEIDRFADGAEFRDFFKSYYGPTVAVYKAIAAEPERITRLDRELAELAARHDLGNGRMEWEYLLVTARRAA
ncbi:class I SAM-dependent methyltransferase [Nocardia sputi]|uniref:class I SAM-dependent methyltransferase n=1 Tax=Nocardia sputi TaxID=2943705 RepID=UPI00189482A8|nr:class I SAM-dependent methyltransferase [Nocardia sputi]MBF6206584.1 class I SAM-dependent methyltransferase [Streptomyces gardneri]UAK32447.1 class I SAM-dependent methyltransferase [Nocardia asteroides]